MGFEITGSKINYAVKHCHLLDEVDFAIFDKKRGIDFQRGGPGCFLFCFFEDTAGTGMGVLDIGSSLLLKVQGFFPVENC